MEVAINGGTPIAGWFINHPANHHKWVVCIPFPNGWFMALFKPHDSTHLLIDDLMMTNGKSMKLCSDEHIC